MLFNMASKGMLRKFWFQNKAREKSARAHKRAWADEVHRDFVRNGRGIRGPEWAEELEQRIDSYESPWTTPSESSDEEAEKKVPEHGRQEINEAAIHGVSHVFWGAYLKCPHGDCPIADENVFCSVYPCLLYTSDAADE